jgi:phosphate acetyltransferase
LNSANIGYKIAQQLGGYKCYGPILLGLSSPISDLSRGATVEDIIGTIILTIMQIKKK